jgi:N6-adenosine-specific RNA methylase IME4
MSDKKYNIIYVDPPWMYKDQMNHCKKGTSYYYNIMNMEDLMALPVKSIAAENCLLAMWWVPPMPNEALKLAEAWGFNFKTMFGLMWHKKTKNGKDLFGLGSYTRTNAEACLFATRGKPQRVSRSVRQVIEAVSLGHSQKPEEARTRLVQLMGDVPRIELFSRGGVPAGIHGAMNLQQYNRSRKN